MEALLYFIFWAALFFLMMRLGCGAHVMGRGHGGHDHGSPESPRQTPNSELRWIPPEKDRDPVCGEVVTTASAKPSVHDGTVYYFCSRECREQFEVAPQLYVGGTTSDTGHTETGKEMERSHV